MLKTIIKQKKQVLSRFLIWGIIVISFAPLNLYGADKKPVKKTSQKSKVQHIEGAFDVNTDRLPPDFRGHSIKKLTEKWSKIDKKDEFETTAQYEEKLKKAGINNVLVFREDASVLYDADNQRFLIKPPRGKIQEERSNLGSFMGQNAFGVKKEFYRSQNEIYTLMFAGFKYFSDKMFGESEYRIFGPTDFDHQFERAKEFNYGYYEIVENILPEVGKKIKDDVKWLIICKIKPGSLYPYLLSGSITAWDRRSKKATIGDPFELEEITRALRVEVHEVWLFNSKTGDILKKRTITGLSEATTIETTENEPGTPYQGLSAQKEENHIRDDDYWKDANKIYKIFNNANQQLKNDSAIVTAYLHELTFAASATAYDEFTLRYANSGYCPTDEKGFAELLNETLQMQNESDERVFCHGLKIVNAIYKFLKTSLRSAQPNEVRDAKPIITQYAGMTSTVLQGMELILQKHGVQ